MGWGSCGKDSRGRRIGYVHVGKCDHPGCQEKIDRGLSYACGGMHGENGFDCERYFCGGHLRTWVEADGKTTAICDECASLLKADPDGWRFDDEEGVWMRTDDPLLLARASNAGEQQ